MINVMAQRQRILLFCPPFSGHFNVLRNMIRSKPDFAEWKIIVTGWNNISLDVGELDSITTFVAADDLHETDPILWTLPRVVQALEQCIEITREFAPDLIVYDFFSVEGKLVGDKLKIPAWSSIPAFIGPNTDQKYLQKKLSSAENIDAIGKLRDQFGIRLEPSDFELVSDGLHLPAAVNLVWSYESLTPQDFMRDRHPNHYVFIGNPCTPIQRVHTASTPTIYISFGTVVMNNLWNNQPNIQKRLKEFIKELAWLWRNEPWQVVIATQGKQLMAQYPPSWTVQSVVDQPAILAQSDVFITHGGSNSFHEAVHSSTPMVVIPFFGDQQLVYKRAVELGIAPDIGLNDLSIDTHAPKNYVDQNLAYRVDRAVRALLNDNSYRDRLINVDRRHHDVFDLFQGTIHFNEGDLLFGTNVARKNYVESNNVQPEFTILEFKAFSEIAPHKKSMPRIVDIYHDVILNDDYFNLDSASGLSKYISRLHDYKEFLNGDSDFETMCIKGLDYFSRYYKINFLLDDYAPSVNRITYAEIEHILKHHNQFKDRVTFYKKISGYWIPISEDNVRKIQRQCDV